MNIILLFALVESLFLIAAIGAGLGGCIYSKKYGADGKWSEWFDGVAFSFCVLAFPLIVLIRGIILVCDSIRRKIL